MMTRWARGWACASALIVATVAMSLFAWADENEALKKGVVRVIAQPEGKQSEGTGFIVKSQAGIVFVVTASHVVGNDQAPRIEFYTEKNRTVAARIVRTEGGDDNNGLAVLAVQGEIPAHTVLVLNQEKQIKPGDAVMVIGFPRKVGVPWAVTTGEVVGRKGKEIILTGAVDEGNSGGPLVKDGVVIGVIASNQGNVTYAVPAVIAKYTLESWNVDFGITLRSVPQTLWTAGVERMVRERRFNHPPDLSKDGFFGSLFGDFEHEFERQTFATHPVVIDRATGLMWQQQGSEAVLPYQAAEMYVEDLNQDRYGGFSDWRVPTLEELASLISPAGMSKGLFIDQAFDPVQTKVWASDQVPPSDLFYGHWYVNFAVGGIAAHNHRVGTLEYHSHFVRAVRSGMEPQMQSGIDTKGMPGKAAEPPQTSLPVEVTGRDGATMRLVQAGPFQMGSDLDKPAGIHTVYLDAYYLDQYEVTVEQYAKFLQASQWKEPRDWIDIRKQLDPKVPMVNINWVDAVAYCSWAGQRLPTEAEWEKAARGTDGRRYPWGDTEPLKAAANVVHSGPKDYSSSFFDYQKDNSTSKWLRIGGSFPADKSPYGISDLAGNVAEWVADWHDSSFQTSQDRNPPGPRSSEHEGKGVRGGSWTNKHSETSDPKEIYRRSQTFHSESKAWTTTGGDLGFRCARDGLK